MVRLDEIAIPLSALTIMIGGVVWLTRLHQLALENRRSIEAIRRGHDMEKKELSDRIDKLEKGVSNRIEALEKGVGEMYGKLDMVIKILESKL